MGVYGERGQKKAYKGGSWWGRWGPTLTLQDRSITWDLGLGCARRRREECGELNLLFNEDKNDIL